MLSTTFIKDLKDELEQKKLEKEQLQDQLTLYDVRIDQYDAIIENMDKSILPLIDEINVAISSVKAAYDARIAAGCKSDLVWTLVATQTYGLPFKYGINSQITQQTWKVTKNPAVQINYSKWGAKYYRRPQNQDYGANIVTDFVGSIGLGCTNLAVISAGATIKLLEGDTITDNLTTPVTFGIDDLPSITGFGVSSVIIDTVDFGGTVAFGSTILAHTGIGTTTGIGTGNVIKYNGTFPLNTTVVGFGTTTITQQVFDFDVGGFISTNVTAKSLIVSSGALSGVTTTFQIGITSNYPSVFLSTSADVAADNVNFTAIRTTQSVLDEFDFSNNPIDPVTIGIMNSNTVGYGHTLVRVNNGSPSGPFQWREVLGEYAAEPACGNGYVTYYSGNLQWPGTITYTYSSSGVAIAQTFAYSSEGATVVVSVGSTLPVLVGYSYTSTSSNNPSFSGCSALDTAITNAESSRDAIIAKNQPTIDATIAASKSLRKLRDKLESTAFCLLQGRSSADAEINRIKKDIKSLESIDLTPFEPTKGISKNKFSGSTVGIATT